jgi:cellulose synthase/poly-beta-1,6-N-acetylglucosamine synthase-like glycosyltransferase
MTAIEVLRLVVTTYATLWSLYLLLLVAVAAVRGRRTGRLVRPGEWPVIAVIIPAGNAQGVIGGCIAALRACHYPSERVVTYVVADHCRDNTAEVAQASSAHVLIRNDGPRGKTYTIAWALGELDRLGFSPDLYLIVDATARVEPDFLTAMAQRWRQGEDIISSHSILSSENEAWYARCLGLMLVHRNLQCWARERRGLSALLEGRGMAYSREYIKRFGWSLAVPKTHGSHPTEDWRHAVRAVEEGYRVGYADEARVATPLRGSLAEATQQGARWERGRLINASTYALRLLWRGLCNRDHVKVFAALDAMQPPVAILAALSTAIAVLTYFIPSKDVSLDSLGYFPLMLVGLYGLIVVVRGRRDGIGLSTVVWGPLYVIWRCSAFILAWVFLDRVSIPKQEAGAARPSPARSPSPVAQPTETDEVTEDAR